MDQMNAAQQEQAEEHAGYLMAYDKKEKRAKGVTGIDADGNLTLEEAAGENRHHFMKVDRYGNILSNFGKNFMYQFNNPSNFLFYNMSKETKPETKKPAAKKSTAKKPAAKKPAAKKTAAKKPAAKKTTKPKKEA